MVKKKSEICYVHGRLLYACLFRHIKEQKLDYINILETGTAHGFSSLCMAKAMSDAQIFGKINTFDVLPHETKMYWNCIDDHKGKHTRAELLHKYKPLTDKYITYIQGNTMLSIPKVKTQRVHFAFLDSAHEYGYLMAEFFNIKEKQLKGDMIFFDDYTPKLFPGVVKAVDEICTTYNYLKEIIIINENRAYVIAQKQ